MFEIFFNSQSPLKNAIAVKKCAIKTSCPFLATRKVRPMTFLKVTDET
jgi:hypothetical protein